MTTLASAVAIGDNQLILDAPLAADQVPGFVEIDDELLDVGGKDNLAGTTLVLSKPAKAAHDAGATVTYAGTPFDPTFKAAVGGAGGEQTMRLLGPFLVDHDPETYTTPTPTQTWDGYTLLHTFENDGLLTDAFAVFHDAGFDQPCYVEIIVIRDTGGSFTPTDYEDVTAATAGQEWVRGRNSRVVVEAGWRLGAAIFPNDTPPTQGSMDFYALIAEPAA